MSSDYFNKLVCFDPTIDELLVPTNFGTSPKIAEEPKNKIALITFGPILKLQSCNIM
jgi:hypothetical protein